VILRVVAVLSVALVFAAPATACAQPRTSLTYLEGQVMCPTCHTTLDQSDSPAAQRIESALVGTYGAAILAAPPHKGLDLLAWWLPIVGVLAGALALAFGVWRWSRGRDAEQADEPEDSGLDEETERRLDDLLARFD
jgi:cytochrome c-type biogenesis protein CcmH/NrfF